MILILVDSKLETSTLEMWLLPCNNNQNLRGPKFWPRPTSSCVQSLCWESNCRHWMLSHGPHTAVNADRGTKRMDRNQEKTNVVNQTRNHCQYHQKLVVYTSIIGEGLPHCRKWMIHVEISQINSVPCKCAVLPLWWGSCVNGSRNQCSKGLSRFQTVQIERTTEWLLHLSIHHLCYIFLCTSYDFFQPVHKNGRVERNAYGLPWQRNWIHWAHQICQITSPKVHHFYSKYGFVWT